jgi:uncharacterized delta-60 repeat protein
VKRRLALLGAMAFVLSIPAGTAEAAAGDLDTTFGGDGIVRSGVMTPATDFHVVRSDTSVQVDDRNRILLGGYSPAVKGPVVVRFTADGAVDPIWGRRFLPGSGRVVGLAVVGRKTIVGIEGGQVERLNANGSLDEAFGAGGVVDTGITLVDLGVDRQGRAFAAGSAGLARVAPSGHSIEISPICLGGGSVCGEVSALAVSPTHVYVSGRALPTATPDWDSAVVGRYLPSGSLDASYGSGGYAWLDPDAASRHDSSNASDIAVSAKSGHVTIVGELCRDYCPHDGSFVARFTAAGTLDPGFDGNVYFGDDQGGGSSDSYPFGVALKNGKSIIVGIDDYCDEGQHGYCFGVERLTSTGARDATFAGTGYTHTAGAPGQASDVRISHGKIVVSGGRSVVRYLG